MRLVIRRTVILHQHVSDFNDIYAELLANIK